MVVIENKDPHPKKIQKFDDDKLQNALFSVFIMKRKQEDKNS